MSTKHAPVETRFFEFHDSVNPFKLRVGPTLEKFTLAYETYGKLNEDRSNAVLLFHAMTGSQHAAGVNPAVPGVNGRWTEELHRGWWDSFIGPGRALDTRKLFVVCANYLGGCYGSTGPTSVCPADGQPWGSRFPVIRMADIVESQIKLLDHLGVGRLRAVVGASIGGLLGMLLAARHPSRVQTVIPIGSGIETTIYQRMLNFEQIAAIESDPHFSGGRYDADAPPDGGLAQARRIAHKMFVSLDALWARARKEVVDHRVLRGWYQMNHPVESYMLHQGEKFTKRFDANSYLRILDAWQWFDLVSEADAENVEDLFNRYRGQEFLVFSIDSDLCFPPSEQAKLVNRLKRAHVPSTWITVHSDKGHDSFLLEPTLFTPHIRQALRLPVSRDNVTPSS